MTENEEVFNEPSKYLGCSNDVFKTRLKIVIDYVFKNGFLRTNAFRGLAFGYDNPGLEKIISEIKNGFKFNIDSQNLIIDTLRILRLMNDRKMSIEEFFLGEPYQGVYPYNSFILVNPNNLQCGKAFYIHQDKDTWSFFDYNFIDSKKAI